MTSLSSASGIIIDIGGFTATNSGIHVNQDNVNDRNRNATLFFRHAKEVGLLGSYKWIYFHVIKLRCENIPKVWFRIFFVKCHFYNAFE